MIIRLTLGSLVGLRTYFMITFEWCSCNRRILLNGFSFSFRWPSSIFSLLISNPILWPKSSFSSFILRLFRAIHHNFYRMWVVSWLIEAHLLCYIYFVQKISCFSKVLVNFSSKSRLLPNWNQYLSVLFRTSTSNLEAIVLVVEYQGEIYQRSLLGLFLLMPSFPVILFLAFLLKVEDCSTISIPHDRLNIHFVFLTSKHSLEQGKQC